MTDKIFLVAVAMFCLLLIWGRLALGQHSLYLIIGVAGLVWVAYKYAQGAEKRETEE